jgi:hypothetical protein
MFMRTFLFAVMAVGFLSSCDREAEIVAASAGAPSPGTPTTVLVELFTSEGCSSCPPADDVLADLVRNQPIEQVTIIGLGEHVDYWDGFGWRDAFSARTFTTRQSDYDARAFHTGNIYTPQAVVDGRFQMVGSDRAAVLSAVRDAARLVRASVTLVAEATSARTLRTEIQVNVPVELSGKHAFEVVAGIAERNLATQVHGGENGGRLLKHGVVARSLVTAGAMKATDRTFSQTISLPLDPAWKRPDLQVVAFVQDRANGRIIGATAGPVKSGEPGD